MARAFFISRECPYLNRKTTRGMCYSAAFGACRAYAQARDGNAFSFMAHTHVPQKYDVVIIGSGAGGGMAAYILTRAGARCLMLEAGDWFDTARDSMMMMWPWQAPHRGAATPAKPFGYFDGCVGGWQVPGEPYTVATGEQFMWWRGRMLGGRTNHWGRIALRWGPYDFKPYSRDGLGFDWPFPYEEMAPYYSKTEKLIGVFGSHENMENAPDGEFLPPPKPRAHELLIQRAARKLTLPCIPSRLSILTQSIHGRPACGYCGQCGRGCATSSNFSSPTVLLPPALATGRLEIRTGAMAREILTGPDGNATGVSYIDKKTRKEVTVRARVVVVAASACESARLLLNSQSSRHPDGLANSSGIVGKYLMDTVGSDVGGYVPDLSGLPPFNEDGVGGMHVYLPWGNYDKQLRHELDFPRGYHIEPGGGRGMPGPHSFGGMHDGYGVRLKQEARRGFGAGVGFSGRGEMIPNENCYCEIDRSVVDEWGIPVLKFHWKWSDYEINMARHMQQTFEELIVTMGGKVTYKSPGPHWGISRGGEIIHEVGTVRCGNDRRTSPLNSWCQSWECKNLFVTDGAPLVSNADKNPTLTILALAWRTSENIARMMRRKEV